MWSKSLLNTRCRICRRKNDPEQMLLCDGCDRGHHMYCLKPKMKKIPDDDWFCNDCKPKMRVRSPKKKSRRVFEEDEEEEEETKPSKDDDSDEGSDDDEGGDDESEDEVCDQDDSPPRRRKRPQRAVDPPKKARKGQEKPKREDSVKGKKKRGGLSQILGQRRCATEANARIARVHEQEIHSGNSSGSDERSERQSSRLRRKATTSTVSLASTPPDQASLSSARSKRRRAVDDDLEGMFNPTVLEDMLNSMMKHKDGWPFDRPITKSDAPDYHKIISKPMDLGTIRSSLNRMKYTCNQEVLEDIRLVFQNCYVYNRSDAGEYQCGVRLERFFNREAKKFGLINSYEDPDSGPETETEPPAKRNRRTL